MIEPRVKMLHLDQLNEEARTAYGESYDAFTTGAVIKGVVNTNTSLTAIASVLLHNPGVYYGLMEISQALHRSLPIPARDRQLVTLRVAWLCQAPVVWSNHAGHAHDAGISDSEVEQVTVGPDAQGWTSHDRALLRMVDELHEFATVSDEVWSELAQHYDVSQLVVLPLLVGHYHRLSYLFNALAVPAPDPTRGGMAAR